MRPHQHETLDELGRNALAGLAVLVAIDWAIPRHSFRMMIEAPLPSLDQLRENAAECIRLAEAARTSQHKSFFIEMAERWLTLAEHAAKTQ
jgi:hypothetical protein